MFIFLFLFRVVTFIEPNLVFWKYCIFKSLELRLTLSRVYCHIGRQYTGLIFLFCIKSNWNKTPRFSCNIILILGRDAFFSFLTFACPVGHCLQLRLDGKDCFFCFLVTNPVLMYMICYFRASTPTKLFFFMPVILEEVWVSFLCCIKFVLNHPARFEVRSKPWLCRTVTSLTGIPLYCRLTSGSQLCSFIVSVESYLFRSISFINPFISNSASKLQAFWVQGDLFIY